MDAVTILRRLLRHRLAVAVGIAVALVAGTLLTYHVELGAPPRFESRQYKIGVASASVLFDSEKSQVSDLGDPKVAAAPGGLAARAQLLANLLVASPLKEQVAQLAQISPQQLITKLSSSDPNVPMTSPPATGVTVRETDPTANILNLTLNDQVPIITFNAQAPSPAVAARLSNAVVVELQRYLQQTASANAVPTFRKLVVERLGLAQSATETRGPTRMRALVTVLLIVGLWCAGILGIEASVRRWRQIAGDEAHGAGCDAVSGVGASTPLPPLATPPAPFTESPGATRSWPERLEASAGRDAVVGSNP
ncbi:MAG: hypothetical protein QOE86_3596 [Solirubrobacteraceae bacterium]|jgi:hypothetical protein|nr:hypothetical protein [Solirubrobacteraceae bacterium]